MTGTPHVAARVAGLSLDRSGQLPDSDYAAMAVRGGLLVDLALSGRLAQTDDSIDLYTTPTGWSPVDRALDELGLLDGRSLDWWLEHSRVRLVDLATALVDDGTWTRVPARPMHRRPRYAVQGSDVLARDRGLLARPELAATGTDAAVVAIALAAGLGAGPAAPGRPAPSPAEDMLSGTGPVAWVCELVTGFVSRARIDGSAVSSASRTALWSTLPY